MGFLTLNAVPDSVTCRALFIPNSEEALAVVRGALEELTLDYYWSKFGALTPEESAAVFVDMFDKFCFDVGGCRMIGEIIAFAGDTSPNVNWLVCDGSEVSQTTYPDLYAVIGTLYGMATAGNFRLPDLQGRSPSGSGTGSGLSPVAVGDKYGEQDHTLTVAELPAHNHTDAGHTHLVTGEIPFLALTGEEPVSVPTGLPTPTSTGYASIQNTGDGDSHNTVGPRLGILYLIVAKDG